MRMGDSSETALQESADHPAGVTKRQGMTTSTDWHELCEFIHSHVVLPFSPRIPPASLVTPHHPSHLFCCSPYIFPLCRCPLPPSVKKRSLLRRSYEPYPHIITLTKFCRDLEPFAFKVSPEYIVCSSKRPERSSKTNGLQKPHLLAKWKPISLSHRLLQRFTSIPRCITRTLNNGPCSRR
jgi:hypothetical protein